MGLSFYLRAPTPFDLEIIVFLGICDLLPHDRFFPLLDLLAFENPRHILPIAIIKNYLYY